MARPPMRFCSRPAATAALLAAAFGAPVASQGASIPLTCFDSEVWIYFPGGPPEVTSPDCTGENSVHADATVPLDADISATSSYSLTPNGVVLRNELVVSDTEPESPIYMLAGVSLSFTADWPDPDVGDIGVLFAILTIDLHSPLPDTPALDAEWQFLSICLMQAIQCLEQHGDRSSGHYVEYLTLDPLETYNLEIWLNTAAWTSHDSWVSVSIVSDAVIPEPATAVLLGLGLVPLALRRPRAP